MAIAFIGDIHGYAPALRMALERCRTENITKIVGLGDYVDGYDGDEECVELIKKHFSHSVRGNHDEFHEVALKSDTEAWLRALPEEIEVDSWLVKHDSPRKQCKDGYVRSSMDAWNCFDDCDFQRCVVGHSHQPMLYRYANEGQFDSEAVDATGDGHVLGAGYRYLLVNPSLAYNRTGTQSPGFAIFDSDTRRVRFVYLDLPSIARNP